MHYVPDRLRRVSSRQNAIIKELRRAFSQGELTPEHHVAVDGLRLVEEAIRSGLKIKAVFVREGSEQRVARLLPQLGAHTETLLLPEDVFNSAITTESPQGVAALVTLPAYRPEDLFSAPDPLIVAAAGLQDPGNLGTIIRSAEAFGATGLIIGEKTVSPFNPKVVRGSAGSIFRLPLVQLATHDALRLCKEHGVRVFATSSHKGVPVDEADLKAPMVLVLGNEGAGLSREVLAECDQTIVIPHSPKVESLNAGIAASVILYEASRQRRRT